MAVGGDLFVQLGVVIVIAGLLALLFRYLRQPSLLAYVLVGVLIGPVLGLVTDSSIIDSMSVIGIAFLLFIVGVEMDLAKLKTVATVSTLGGAIQISTLFGLSYLVALFLGFLPLEAAYVGLMMSFSSTMIVMKFLSDRRELDTLHGRIIVGILLMEDIVAIFALSILSSFNEVSFSIFGTALLKFLSLFLIAYLASKFIFPKIFKFAAKTHELLLVSSLAVCFLFSLLFHYLGFSIAIGAFVAGLTLGNLEYSFEIIGKVRSLRDFFALLFFVSLGLAFSPAVIGGLWLPLLIFIGIILLFKPLLILTITTLFRYTKRPAFNTSMYLTQAGEFALIIASQGMLLGHVGKDFFSMVVLVVLASVTFTSYAIKYQEKMFKKISLTLSFLDRFNTEGLEYIPTDVEEHNIVLCGHDKIGYSILRQLSRQKKHILIVDYNPEVITSLAKRGYHCLYGEVTDEEIIEKMELKSLKMLISTIPFLNENLMLIRKTRDVNKKARIICTAEIVEDALKMYAAGADYVIVPDFIGGAHAANVVTLARKRQFKFNEEKESHIEELKERRRIGHDKKNPKKRKTHL